MFFNNPRSSIKPEKAPDPNIKQINSEKKDFDKVDESNMSELTIMWTDDLILEENYLQ